jgi:copper transport protein
VSRVIRLWTGLANLATQRKDVVSRVGIPCGRLLLFTVGCIVSLLDPSSVWAHAVPRTTLPAANAVLPEAPREITIRFSERVEARASSLRVFDAHGTRLDDGTAAVIPGDPWLYGMTLPPIGTGVYTVSWRVVSADDGHVTEGAYVFVVGGTANSGPPEADQVIAVTGWLDALARWLGMLGAVALIGMLTASVVFWRRRLPRIPPPSYVLSWLAVLLLISSLTLLARLQRLPVEGSGRAGLGIVMSSTIGQITAAKLGVVVLLGGALVGYWCVSGGRTWSWAMALFLTVLLLMSDALVSHSAATPAWRGLALGAELLHLLGVTLWVGGLGYFATLFWWGTLRESSAANELAWAIPAFSLLAVVAVGLLTVSGLYLTQLHLGSLNPLFSTSYGRILLAKLSVVALMMALGGYHQFIVHPRILASLEQSGHSAIPHSQKFRQTLRIEALLGLLALLLASFLGTTAPPSTPPPDGNATFRQARAVGEAQLVIEVWPLRPGPNEIRLTVTDPDGLPLIDATAALLQLQVAGTETAPIGVTLEREAPGVFVKRDAVLGIEGKWRGRVTIQRQGAYDLNDRFELLLTWQSDHHAPTPTSGLLPAVAGFVYLGTIGVTVFLLILSKRRLSNALQGIEVSNQHQMTHPDRR